MKKGLFREETAPFMMGFLAVLYLRFLVVIHTLGTNDGFALETLGGLMVKDWRGIYGTEAWVPTNYPPAAYWLAWFCTKFAAFAGGLAFHRVIRFFIVLADFASLYFIWDLLVLYGTRHRKLILWLCLLNPVNFLVAAFHCQLDPIVMTCVIASICMLERGKPAAAGLCFGLGLSFKIFPLALLPAYVYFFIRRKSFKAALLFGACAAAVFFVIFAPYLIADPVTPIKKIFSNSGLGGVWGISALLLRPQNTPLYDWYFAAGRYLCLAVSVAALWVLRGSRLNLCEACFVCWGVFFALTSGFSVQYLSWYSALAIMVFPAFGAAYTVIAGFLLFRIYGYWCDWKSPWYGDSFTLGQWAGFDLVLDRFLWAFMAVVFVIWFVQKARSTRNFT